MFDVRSFETKNKEFEFDYLKLNMFKSVQCPNKCCSSQLDEQFSKSSIRSHCPLFYVRRSFKAKSQVLELDCQKLNMVENVPKMMLKSVQCSINIFCFITSKLKEKLILRFCNILRKVRRGRTFFNSFHKKNYKEMHIKRIN